MHSIKAVSPPNTNVPSDSDSEDEGSSRNCRTPTSSKSNKESMFEFLKRRKRNGGPTSVPPADLKLAEPSDERDRSFKSMLLQGEVSRNESPTNKDSQSQNDQIESELSQGEVTTRKTATARGTGIPIVSCSPKAKAESPCFPSKHKQIVELFKDLAQCCNSYAQSGMQYRNHSETFMSQALELARRVSDPSLKSQLIELRNCWRTVQNMFRDFQMMDASETVNSMRLIIFEQLQIDQVSINEKQCSAVQTEEDPTRSHLENSQIILASLKEQHSRELEILKFEQQKIIDDYKCQLRESTEKIGILEKSNIDNQADIEGHKQKVNQLESKQLYNHRTQSKRRLSTIQDKQNVLLVDSGTFQHKVDLETTIRDNKIAHILKKEKPKQVWRQPIPQHRSAWQNHNLISQLHETGNQLYSYWTTLKFVRDSLVSQKLYHRVSEHFESIDFNDRLYT